MLPRGDGKEKETSQVRETTREGLGGRLSSAVRWTRDRVSRVDPRVKVAGAIIAPLLTFVLGRWSAPGTRVDRPVCVIVMPRRTKKVRHA